MDKVMLTYTVYVRMYPVSMRAIRKSPAANTSQLLIVGN